jgi:hypothetical protein
VCIHITRWERRWHSKLPSSTVARKRMSLRSAYLHSLQVLFVSCVAHGLPADVSHWFASVSQTMPSQVPAQRQTNVCAGAAQSDLARTHMAKVSQTHYAHQCRQLKF